MPASNAVQSFGTLLKFGSPLVTIAEVKEIGGLEMSAVIKEVTNHSSPGAFKEKIATMIDAGTLNFKVNFIPSNATQSFTAGLGSNFLARTSIPFSMVFPTSPTVTWTFAGPLEKFKIMPPLDGVLEGDFSVAVSGQPTLV